VALLNPVPGPLTVILCELPLPNPEAQAGKIMYPLVMLQPIMTYPSAPQTVGNTMATKNMIANPCFAYDTDY